jgi:transposase-like protein
MEYALAFQESIVKKVLTGSSVVAVSQETGLSTWRIYRWIKDHRSGSMVESRNGPRGMSLPQKQELLLESKSISAEDSGEWLRKNGIHSDHLDKWKKEIEDVMNKNSAEKIENLKLKKENYELQKELARKEKALAELAALLTLKKKYQHLWEDEEK